MKSWQKALVYGCTIAALGSALGGCAAGKLFMAGYQPPQTIADLLNEQYGLAGELPPELDPELRKKQTVSLDSYKGNVTRNSGEHRPRLEYSIQEQYRMQAPPQRFMPQFTYKSVQDYAGQLAMELYKNGNGLNAKAMIGISSFVKLDESLQNTSVLGNQLAEYSISEIQQFGLNVIDFKLMPAIEVRNNGDLAFSRDVMQLAKQNLMDHVMSGTMIEKADGVFVNARIISLKTNRVVSTASVLIPHFVSQQSQLGYLQFGAE